MSHRNGYSCEDTEDRITELERRLAKASSDLVAAESLLERCETAMGKNIPEPLRDEIWQFLDRYRRAAREKPTP